MIRVIDTVEQLIGMKESWDELLESSYSPSIFLSHEWLCSWWKHLSGNRKLVVLAAYDGDRLIGICPLALRQPNLLRMTPPTLEFLGSGVIGSDYLDLILRIGRQEEALLEIQEYLEQAGYVLEFSQLRRGVSNAERLGESLAESGWRTSNTQINVCPFIDLAGHTWESYCASLGSSQRYNFQRRLKNISKSDGFRVDCAREPEDALRNLEVLMDLHQKRWAGREGQSEAFQTASVRDFHREFVERAAHRGWVRLFVLRVEDKPAAALYGFRHRDTFSFYQSGFDPDFAKQSVGLVMMGLAIKSALDEGCVEYDFLHGGEEYKFHWTSHTRELGRLEVFPGAGAARIYRHAMGLNRTARRMAKRVLQRA